jgi:hypothetical protein
MCAAIIAAVLAVALTGCGGSGAAPAQPPPAPSADSVAADHQLISGKHITPTLYAAQEEDATDGAGHHFDVVTFRTNELRDKWLKAAAQFGSFPRWTGDRYAIVPSD